MSLDSRLVNLAALGRKLVEGGFARGMSGSISLHWEDQCYISPAGGRLDRLSAADFVPLSIQGSNTWQTARASRDHAVHLACYRARPDAQNVILVHPPHCLALGCAGLGIGAISPDFYRAVGAEAPLLPYSTPGTQALADAFGQAMAGHDALLLRNIGLVLVAANSDEALLHSQIVEEAARIMLLALAATGSCSFLTPEQIEELGGAGGR
jgi:ribulose-5-phosphate 4-epimerase/fuculose-1-phosphate aldolase